MEFLHEETDLMCLAHDKCLEMVAPRYSSRTQESSHAMTGKGIPLKPAFIQLTVEPL